MRGIAVVFWIMGGVATAVGANAGYEFQCKEPMPGSMIFAVAGGWPAWVPWAAMKNGSPLWTCDDMDL